VISVTLHVAQQTHPLSANVRPHIYTFLVQIATLSERYVPILTRPLRRSFLNSFSISRISARLASSNRRVTNMNRSMVEPSFLISISVSADDFGGFVSREFIAGQPLASDRR